MRPKTSDSRSRGHQDRGRCGKCGRTHEGACSSDSGGDSVCFKCGRIGHFSRDCTATTTQGSDLICFHCIQRDHKKAQYPSLLPAVQVIAHAPTTLRITDDHHGRAEAIAREEQGVSVGFRRGVSSPNVSGAYLLFSLSSYVMISLLWFCIDIGKGISDLVACLR